MTAVMDPPATTTTGTGAHVLEALTEEEACLWAILQDVSGLDQAEFLWYDSSTDDGCFRAWPFQWTWWRCNDGYQIDQCARSVGKSLSIKVRGFAFPFLFPGQEMVITAPELVHLEPIVGLVENQIYNTRLSSEMMMKGKSAVTHRPFQMNFANDARLIGRIPQRDGKGVKGIHPIWLELDEAQDYPHQGWTELTETLKRGFEGAVWRAHGVTRGLRDDFFEYTQDKPDNHWTIHRYPAMFRPNWTDEERQEKIKQYGSSDDPDYRRNVLGLHGDATNPLFVLTRLMRCVDDDPLTDYNVDEYTKYQIKDESLGHAGGDIAAMLDYPSRHLKYLGADPKKQKAIYWVGMDVGYTVDPTEILVWVEYRHKPNDEFTTMRLLTRVALTRIGHTDQIKAILHTIDFYKPKVWAMDRGGLGQPLTQEIQEWYQAASEGDPGGIVPGWAKQYNLKDSLSRLKGYNFSEKIIVDFDPLYELEDTDEVTDAAQRRNTKEYASDKLRALVDSHRIELPWDEELLKQWQGGTWTSAKGMQDQYGRRIFSKGNDHTLDAGRFFALGWAQYGIEEILNQDRSAPSVLAAFMS